MKGYNDLGKNTIATEELRAKTFEERKLDMEIHAWLHANNISIYDYIDK